MIQLTIKIIQAQLHYLLEIPSKRLWYPFSSLWGVLDTKLVAILASKARVYATGNCEG